MSYKTERRKNFLKDYFGFLPLIGATITAGAVGGAAFMISLASDSSKTAAQIIAGSNGIDAISSLYQHAGSVAGQYLMPAGGVGQFLTYKCKRSISSVFRR